MSNLQQLRRRIKSIKSIHQITKAMEMIATSKMKKATMKVLKARDYSKSVDDILVRLKDYPHILLKSREVKNIALIFATGDRGLCGDFNSALLKTLTSFIKEKEGKGIYIITVGKKGREFVTKFFPQNFLADFTGIKDEILYEEITPIAHFVIRDYINQKYDEVFIIYSHFVSGFTQQPLILQLLPVGQRQNVRQNLEYLLEPSPAELLEILVPQFIETQIYQALLESKASEHSARMLAMKNATENAKDLMDELYLTYHSIRQDTITSELTDMITAKRALED